MAARLPALAGEGNLGRYLQEIRKFPLLEQQEEYESARKWRDHGDREAAHKLVTSHLRLVAKIAMGYRGYGLPISELISEGNVGLMQAVRKFDPDKIVSFAGGPERRVRLATYAMWWIRAAIQEYILHSWSLVKMGTTAAQKKLFFNLRKAKAKVAAMDELELTPDNVRTIAKNLGVTEQDVIQMNRRLLAPDSSLNAPLRADGESDAEWQDWLVDERDNQETALAESDEFRRRRLLMNEAMQQLTERERQILVERRLTEEPATLEDLSTRYNVSRERVRQIEVRAFEKLQKAIRALAAERTRAAEAAIDRRRTLEPAARAALPRPGE